MSTRFTRDQLVGVVEAIFAGAWNRILAVLPADNRAAHEAWREHEPIHRCEIDACCEVLRETLRAVHSLVTGGEDIPDDSSSIHYDLFRSMVLYHVGRVLAKIVYPSPRDREIVGSRLRFLAEDFVDDHFALRRAGLSDDHVATKHGRGHPIDLSIDEDDRSEPSVPASRR